MTPAWKDPNLDAELTRMFGHDRRACIEANVCVPPPIGCGKPVDPDGFPDEASRAEYANSGLCLTCQRAIFGY